jgi:hypothetical protein
MPLLSSCSLCASSLVYNETSLGASVKQNYVLWNYVLHDNITWLYCHGILSYLWYFVLYLDSIMSCYGQYIIVKLCPGHNFALQLPLTHASHIIQNKIFILLCRSMLFLSNIKIKCQFLFLANRNRYGRTSEKIWRADRMWSGYCPVCSLYLDSIMSCYGQYIIVKLCPNKGR